MENLKATNEQLKNEAMALRTTLEAEIKNETRAEHIAKLYTIIFDEQLSADPQGSLALSMILNMKTAVGLTTELTIFMNSAEKTESAIPLSHFPLHLSSPHTLPASPSTQNQHINMGPIFTRLFQTTLSQLERETSRLYGGRKFPKTLQDFLNTIPRRCFEVSSSEALLRSQCDILAQWNEAGRRWRGIIGEGDEMVAKVVGEKFGRMRRVDGIVGGLLGKCCVSEREVLEKEFETIRSGYKLANSLLDSAPGQQGNPQVRAMMECMQRALMHIEEDKDIIYHMQELANKLGQDGAAEYFRLGLNGL